MLKKVGFGSIATQGNNKLIIYSDEGKDLYQRTEPKTISDVFYREDKDKENNYLIVVLGDNHIELKPYLSYSPEKKLVEEK